jgi:hypothetical protein
VEDKGNYYRSANPYQNLKKEGYDWANQAVRYYLANNGEEKIYFKDAATYNLVGDKIEKPN